MCVVKRLRSNGTRCARLTTVSRTSARSLSTSSHPPGEHSRGGSRGRTQRADRRTSGRTDRVARQRRGHALRTSTRSPGAMSASTLRCRSMCSSTSRPRGCASRLVHRSGLRGWRAHVVVDHWAHKDVAPEAFTAMGVEAFRGFRNQIASGSCPRQSTNARMGMAR